MTFSCEIGRDIYRYDVKTGQIENNPLNESFHSLRLADMVSTKDFLTYAGAATGFVSVEETLRFFREGKVNGGEVAAAILGSVSGFSLGYWLYSELGLECNSGKIPAILDEEKNWSNIVTKFIEYRVRRPNRLFCKGYEVGLPETDLSWISIAPGNREQQAGYLRKMLAVEKAHCFIPNPESVGPRVQKS